MRLFIAEKPSLGRAISMFCPSPTRRGGLHRDGAGDVVTWCIGHLLEQAEPDAYDAAYKQWRMEQLPIVPSQWQLVAKPKTRSQLAVIKRLIKQADCVVNAGDPDREGQLLVDEVIDFLGYPKLKPVQRCLISDLNPPRCAGPSTSCGTTRSSYRWRCRRWPAAGPTGSMAST